MIKRERQGNNAANGDKTVRRLDPDHATVGGWQPHRTTRIGPERTICEIGSDRHRGATGRAARIAVESPGIAHGTKVADGIREFIQICLAHEDSPGGCKATHNLSIFPRDAIIVDLAGSGGTDAGCIYVVLESNGNAMKRSKELACLLLLIQDSGLCESRFGQDRNVGVHLGVINRNTVQARLGQSRRGDLTGTDLPRRFSDA